ncbi:MAG TPA: Ig-like domain-containing protein [Candidatus Limnocylindrales bacterium]|nr:Ig-like domain-containing protein [Candidatus Limnocylindrales bacterium]
MPVLAADPGVAPATGVEAADLHRLDAAQLAKRGLKAGSGVCEGLFEALDAPVAQPDKPCTHGADHAAGLLGTGHDHAAHGHADAGSADASSTPSAIIDSVSLTAPVQPNRIPCYSTGPYVRVFYIYHSGTTNRFSQRLPRIKEAVATADYIINRSANQTKGTRHVKWRVSSTCRLAVIATSANLSYTDPSYLARNLTSRGLLKSTEKALVFTEQGPFCGGIAMLARDTRASSYNYNNRGGMLARVFMGPCLGYGLSNLKIGEVAAHEVVHTLGGVQRNAPYATYNGHCYDESDVMCYVDGAGVVMKKICAVTVPELLDCRKNTYFHTNPPSTSYLYRYWNTARNVFLARGGTTRWETLPRPAISLTAPANGSIVGGDSLPVTATATAPTGSAIARVDFNVNGSWLGADTSAPYGTTIATGAYANGTVLKIQAATVDTFGRVSYSALASVTVGNPSVSLVTPADGAAVGGWLDWTATASAYTAAGRSVARVELFVDGVLRATDTTAPYGGRWVTASLPDGSHQVAARVVDSGGLAVTSASRAIYLTSPTVYQATEQLISGRAGTLRAEAYASASTPISRVEWLVGTNMVAQDYTAPYERTWTPGAASTAVTVRVVDAGGRVGTDPTPEIVLPNVSISVPVSGATVSGTTVPVSAAMGALNGFVVDSVEFYADGYGWLGSDTTPGDGWRAVWDTTWYADGTHQLTAVATVRHDGLGAWDSVTSLPVTVSVSNPVTP